MYSETMMRVIGLNGMKIVHMGCMWPHTDIEPSSKNASMTLERNEALVTWLQPLGGTMEDQTPTIRLNEKEFYVLSLRCMKVICAVITTVISLIFLIFNLFCLQIVFRHVRLHKGFQNKELNSFGYWKLKIPMCLMREKIRTQSRFNVSICVHVCREKIGEPNPLKIGEPNPHIALCKCVIYMYIHLIRCYVIQRRRRWHINQKRTLSLWTKFHCLYRNKLSQLSVNIHCHFQTIFPFW